MNIILTGASSGIGYHTAKSLSYIPVNKIIVIARREENLEKLKADSKGNIYPISFDLENGDYDKLIGKIVEVFRLDEDNKIDILINNAGITKDTLFMRMKDGDWDSVIDTNLNGVYNVTRVVVPAMVKKRSGNITNISSVVGFTGNVGQVNYSATKSALTGFTRSLAKELGGRGIRVNCIAPGYITTDMTEKIPAKIKEELLKSIPLKREGEPKEIADVCLFLASNMASYITGTVIHVNGGLF